MQIACTHENETVSVKVHGNVDSFTYHLFAKEISLIHRIGAKKVTIDLLQCEFINFSAIKLLSRYESINQKKNRQYTYLTNNQEFITLFKLMVKSHIQIRGEQNAA